jgi:hypothetical protein
LISLDFESCFFSGQFKQTLDLQGPAAHFQQLSTKLSTEVLDSGESRDKSMTCLAFQHFN